MVLPYQPSSERSAFITVPCVCPLCLDVIYRQADEHGTIAPLMHSCAEKSWDIVEPESEETQ